LKPDLFYKASSNLVPKEYRHVEPSYCLEKEENNIYPVVDIAKGAYVGNFIAAFSYIIIGIGAACIRI
jgi:hypothetical protein